MCCWCLIEHLHFRFFAFDDIVLEDRNDMWTWKEGPTRTIIARKRSRTSSSDNLLKSISLLAVPWAAATNLDSDVNVLSCDAPPWCMLLWLDAVWSKSDSNGNAGRFLPDDFRIVLYKQRKNIDCLSVRINRIFSFMDFRLISCTSDVNVGRRRESRSITYHKFLGDRSTLERNERETNMLEDLFAHCLFYVPNFPCVCRV